jgi:hypothetical protein
VLRFKKRTKILNERSIPLSVLIFLEISAIVVGVMLGFTVNEWRENRNNRKIAGNVLQTIAAEMSYNHNQIVNSFDYYYTILEKIDNLAAIDREKARTMYGYEIEGWRGAMTPMLRSSAYQMALMTGIIKDIPFENANKLSNVYTIQSILEKLDDAMIVNFSQDPGFTNLQTIRHMFNLYVEIMPSVIGLYQLYGLPVLEDYGYTMQVEPGILLDEMNYQMEGYPGL